MTEASGQKGVVFQLGAREHYAVPRMLDALGCLKGLVTDAWVEPGSPWARVPGSLGRRLRERWHPALAQQARVESLTGGLLAFETAQRFSPPPTPWHGFMRRNEWFEKRAVAIARRGGVFEGKPTVLAYSYAALGIFRAAKTAGCPTVLMQIDPAILEECVVRRECSRWERKTRRPATWTPAPSAYWRRWQEETRVADRVIVNSEWSREALERVGVAKEKIRMVPLAYEPPAEALGHQRKYLEVFTKERPLRVLFLGSLVLRKGIARVFDAVRLLRSEPVVFRFVGSPEVDLPDDLAGAKEIEWLEAVPRGDVHGHYRWADVFLFPTLSDGFGLTQIEAAAWGLPLIVSRRCGEVVRDGVEGMVLTRPSGEVIAKAVRRFLSEGLDGAAMSANARRRAEDFAPARVASLLSSALME